MVRPEIIRKRLNRLDEYLGILRTLRRYGREEFLESAERFLHQAIEALIDMGHHIVADEGLGVVD